LAIWQADCPGCLPAVPDPLRMALPAGAVGFNQGSAWRETLLKTYQNMDFLKSILLYRKRIISFEF